jgi:hypothetical protein
MAGISVQVALLPRQGKQMPQECLAHHSQIPQPIRVVLATSEEVPSFMVKLDRRDLAETCCHCLNTDATDRVPQADMLVF